MRFVAGRDAIHRENKLIINEAKSVKRCAASVSTARLPATYPPTKWRKEETREQEYSFHYSENEKTNLFHSGLWREWRLGSHTRAECLRTHGLADHKDQTQQRRQNQFPPCLLGAVREGGRCVAVIVTAVIRDGNVVASIVLAVGVGVGEDETVPRLSAGDGDIVAVEGASGSPAIGREENTEQNTLIRTKLYRFRNF